MRKLTKPLLFVKSVTGYSIFTVVVVALVSTWALFEATKAEVVVAANGDLLTVKTHTETVGDLLDDLGIDVGEYDDLSHALDEDIEGGMEILLEPAHYVAVVTDGKIDEYITTARTVGEFLEEHDIQLTEYDDISEDVLTEINGDLGLIINKAFAVKLVDGEDVGAYWTTGETVQDLLKKYDITLNEYDKIEPEIDEQVKKGTNITITRVEKKKEEVEEAIPFETEEKNDNSLLKGKSKVVTEGQDGVALKTYEITYENGEEVNRELVEEETVEPSTNKVVAVGTKVEKKKAPKATPAPKGGKTFIMESTAYGPDCNGCSGRTAYGININKSPMPKVVAVDPNVIPLGTRVWVEGYGEAIAGDTGGAIKGNRIDVLVKSEAYAASHWGRKNVKVKILD